MQFRITFKTPGALDSALEPYIDTHCEHCDEHDYSCVNCCNLEDKACQAISGIKAIAEKYIRHGECITVVFDTDAGTATVVPAKR